MKILLVDDHPVFRSGMAVMLGKLFAGPQIVEAGDTAAFRRAVASPEVPDLVLLDLLMPGFDAIGEFPQLRRRLPLTPIVAVSMISDPEMIEQVMAAGANGFVSKTVRPGDMSGAFLAVMEGETVVLRSPVPLGEAASVRKLSALTNRQLDVLRHVARGLSNKEIARELDISPYTVRAHLSAILRILGLSTRSAVASFAVSRGFS